MKLIIKLAKFAIALSIAYPVFAEGPVEAPCAILERFGGQVYLLDSTRTKLTDAVQKSKVFCGGWFSVENGWAELRHRDGFQIHVDANTFLEMNPSSKKGDDQIVLYKGEVFAIAENDSSELRIATPNARARVKDGAALVLFNQSSETTQMTSLDGKQSFENRFEASRTVYLKAGEASSMNLKALRVVPSTPRVVTVASLRGKLAQMHVEVPIQANAFRAVVRRQERKFASVVTKDFHPAQEHAGEERQNVSNSDGSSDEEAGTETAKKVKLKKKKSRFSYERHQVSESDLKLQAKLMRKTVGEDADGVKLMYPSRSPASADAEIDVELEAKKKAETKEKKRLIEELSKIKGEQ